MRNNQTAMGAGARDCNDMVLGATFGPLGTGSTIEYEIWALRHEIDLAKSIDAPNVTFWTDSTIIY